VAIKKKFNSLFKAYKKDKLANNVYGESRHECKYYDQFEYWLSQTLFVQKHVSASANDLDLYVEDFVALTSFHLVALTSINQSMMMILLLIIEANARPKSSSLWPYGRVKGFVQRHFIKVKHFCFLHK
jgi:hypothetical protein